MDHEVYDNKEAHLLPNDGVTNDETLPSTAEDEKLKISPTSPQHIDKDNLWLPRCRVCQCIDSDSKRDDALRFLVITPPRQDSSGKDVSVTYDTKRNKKNISCTKSESVEFVSPTGEIFVCSDDIEKGPHCHQDALIHLGCSCKGDLSFAHYACALRWFYFRKAKSCEICGSTVENVRTVDLKKIRACLEEFESLKKRTEAGEHSFSQVQTNLGVDPDAVAAIRRQRLTEAATYFNPQTTSEPTLPRSQPQSLNTPSEDDVPADNSRTQWAVESTGILVATGLLTVTLAWLIAPHVGKRTAKSGLHILLGGFCALTVVVFLRFAVLPRIKYGPARYWAILFVFWFLVFGIWASRTHGAHST